MRYLVIGDIHGNLPCLMDVLNKCNFDRNEDVLIGIGDYTDGHLYSAEVVEYLIGLPNFIGIRGNHDVWVEEYLRYKSAQLLWLEQGGYETINSYKKTGYDTEPYLSSHIKFFSGLHDYYVLGLNGKNYAFVHGGWSSRFGLGYALDSSEYQWDRKLWIHAMSPALEPYSAVRTKMYDKVFIGHTAVTKHPKTNEYLPVPIKRLNIINVDQGAGYDGWLTVCDIETEECWQSVKSVGGGR